MSDAITALVGAVLMIAFLLLIAVKLIELPVWIFFITGIVLMLYATFTDTIRPLLSRRQPN